MNFSVSESGAMSHGENECNCLWFWVRLCMEAGHWECSALLYIVFAIRASSEMMSMTHVHLTSWLHWPARMAWDSLDWRPIL